MSSLLIQQRTVKVILNFPKYTKKIHITNQYRLLFETKSNVLQNFKKYTVRLDFVGKKYKKNS